ncbi:hypothetical protein J6590_102908 [Homalodisca vitripennis]|nr:hypothetical protein J6590_102908 [Homalodisca vitripennis]
MFNLVNLLDRLKKTKNERRNSDSGRKSGDTNPGSKKYSIRKFTTMLKITKLFGSQNNRNSDSDSSLPDGNIGVIIKSPTPSTLKQCYVSFTNRLQIIKPLDSQDDISVLELSLYGEGNFCYLTLPYRLQMFKPRDGQDRNSASTSAF